MLTGAGHVASIECNKKALQFFADKRMRKRNLRHCCMDWRVMLG